MHTLTGLTDGRHELVITALGVRDGLTDGRNLLFDYALVSQKVGEVSGCVIFPTVFSSAF